MLSHSSFLNCCIQCTLFICSVELTDNCGFHVIVLPFDIRKRYVTSAEVSALLWDEDVVRMKVYGLVFLFQM